MHIHILGICGTLMGSIAILATQRGDKVTGSDRNVYPPMSDQLRAAGIELREGYLAANIPEDVDLVMIGNAGLPRGNEAVEHVLDRGIPYISGAEWLGRYLLPDRWVIAVAGTHGKTTTTSMVAWILEYAGLSPGFLVGGVPANFPVSARLGETPFFVIEADEYDTSYFDRRAKFLHYRPRTAILGNLEYDHADIFPDLAAIQSQFHLLIRTIPGSGAIIHPAIDENLHTVFEMGCWSPRITFSSDETKADVTAADTVSDYSEFAVMVDGRRAGRVAWQLTGRHNLCNALAAVAACRHAGVHPETACRALCEFKGVKRRMELIHSTGKLSVYDDFAHHPTAIRLTLEGFRRHVGDDRIVAVIEPGSHTMKKGTHRDSLASSTGSADETIWYRPENVDWDMAAILNGKHMTILDDIDELVAETLRQVDPRRDTHVVIMSNSGFGGFRQKLVDALTNA